MLIRFPSTRGDLIETRAQKTPQKFHQVAIKEVKTKKVTQLQKFRSAFQVHYIGSYTIKFFLQAIFNSTDFVFEKQYDKDYTIIDIPFNRKGQIKRWTSFTLGEWKIFFDAQSKQLFCFNDVLWYDLMIIVSNKHIY